MASRTTNEGVRLLQQRHRAQIDAVTHVAAAGQRVEAAVQRRVDEVSRLDAAVTQAETELSVALAVLATLLHDDELAASTAGVDEVKVRTARRVVARDVVASRIRELGVSVPRRRGARLSRSKPEAGDTSIAG